MRKFWSLLFALWSLALFAQDPLRFADEVRSFENTAERYPKEKRIVFTGSSSIRLWTDFNSYFPTHNVINTAFGGSETSDLIYYKDLLISQFQPEQVFIYEGDNDLNSGKSVLATTRDLIRLISELKEDGVQNIVIISPKPSVARWQLKENYEQLNEVLSNLAKATEGLKFADVWTPMLNKKGELIEELFLPDDLHMNKKGYDIWIKVISPLLID